MSNTNTQTLRTVEMAYCARCYGYVPPREHPVSELEPAMVFQPFGNPIIDSNGTAWTHWGMCPVAHAPVLMTDLRGTMTAFVPGTTPEFRMECAECGQPTTNRVAVTVGANRRNAWLCPMCWWHHVGEATGAYRRELPITSVTTAPA